jgi:hypothetical protein
MGKLVWFTLSPMPTTDCASTVPFTVFSMRMPPIFWSP